MRRIAFEVDRPAAESQLAEREGVLLENQADGLEVEVGREVGDGHVLGVERPRDLGFLALVGDEVAVIGSEGVDMALLVHAHEGGKLHEAGVDPAAGAAVAPRHAG